ncbi:7292_t:CDS:10 [Entrophospora sp. SA101]|nr:7292_t:CDS:10 [Entrophospora sp. SA101]
MSSSNNQLPCLQKLSQANESTWIVLGATAELMHEDERAMSAYESALRHNVYSIPALQSIAALYRSKEQFPKAIEYFQRILNIDSGNGEIWGALGHCYLMMDDLQKAYNAYQQALYHLPNPREPKLWYGIGILYDRYGSLDHAEEAFSQVLRMESKFEKANEIYFRLGIIYKQQQKYDQSLQVDIWFQIGHVYEQQKNFVAAKEAYERVLAENPNHAKVLQQLGWLYHQQNASFNNQDLAINFLTKSLESDPNDAQSWYLLGRCYMAQQKYNKAYEAYQQAVRAIRLNPYISEVWYDLGTLYESCNNQTNDAIDAYQRAAELDPNNAHIKQRLQILRNQQQIQGGSNTSGSQPSSAAQMAQDINPQAYHQQQPNGPPPPSFSSQQTPPPPHHQPPPMPTYGSRPIDNRPIAILVVFTINIVTCLQ